ncbi:MAG: hypothetical protein ACYCVN_04935 [Acidimicrobiales bacterium]
MATTLEWVESPLDEFPADHVVFHSPGHGDESETMRTFSADDGSPPSAHRRYGPETEPGPDASTQSAPPTDGGQEVANIPIAVGAEYQV